jgi:hypothetical protein
MWHIRGRADVIQSIGLEMLKERDHLEGKGKGRVMLKWIVRRCPAWIWTEFIWFETGRSDGLI